MASATISLPRPVGFSSSREQHSIASSSSSKRPSLTRIDTRASSSSSSSSYSPSRPKTPFPIIDSNSEHIGSTTDSDETNELKRKDSANDFSLTSDSKGKRRAAIDSARQSMLQTLRHQRSSPDMDFKDNARYRCKLVPKSQAAAAAAQTSESSSQAPGVKDLGRFRLVRIPASQLNLVPNDEAKKQSGQAEGPSENGKRIKWRIMLHPREAERSTGRAS